MDQREEFEAAYAATVVEVADGNGWGNCTMTETLQLLASCRTSDDAYVFDFKSLAPIDNILTTGMVNAAWWSWRAGQATVLAKMQGSTGHVVH